MQTRRSIVPAVAAFLFAPLVQAEPAAPPLPQLPAAPTATAAAPPAPQAPSAPAPATQAAPPAPSAPAAPRPGATPPPYMVQQPYEPPPPYGAYPPPQGYAPPGYAPGYGPGYPAPAYGAPVPGYPPPTYLYPYAPPAGYGYEPPPPPPPVHRAPAAALWLGARVSAVMPFGKLWYTDSYRGTGPDWSDYASAGPAIELDAGGRFSRRYMVYGFWQHAALGSGQATDATRAGADANLSGLVHGVQTSASTDLVGLGLRWTSSPDDVGFVVDLGFGYRWLRVKFDDDTTLRLESPFEIRLGFGADIRVTRTFALSPMFVLTDGVFTDGHFESATGTTRGLIVDQAGHGTAELMLGAHFDVAGR